MAGRGSWSACRAGEAGPHTGRHGSGHVRHLRNPDAVGLRYPGQELTSSRPRSRITLSALSGVLAAWSAISCGARSDIDYGRGASSPSADAALEKDVRAAEAGDIDVREGGGSDASRLDARGVDACEGALCEARDACVNGACCSGGLQSCAGSCVNLTADPSNCGTCGTVCPTRAACQAGECLCPPGTHACADACVDDDSVDHCGASCTSCPTPPNSAGAACDGTSCSFSCISGLTPCGAACANVQTDPMSCGACGHDCLGGACIAGVCQPVVLTTGQPDLLFLAVNATDLYWTTDPGAVVTMPIAGGTPRILVSSSWSLEGIAIDSTTIYYSTYGGGSIMTLPLGGGVPSTFASGLERPIGVAVDALNLYYADFESGFIFEIPITGGSATPIVPEDTGTAGVAVRSNTLYWASPPGVLDEMPVTGGTTSTLGADQVHAFGIAVDHTTVYWTTLYGGNVLSMPMGGGTVTTLVNGLSAYSSGIAVDDKSIYWCATSSNEVGSIMRLAK